MSGGSSRYGICAQCHAKQPRRCRKPAGFKHVRRLKLLRHMRAVSCKAALLLWHNLRGLSMSGGSSRCGICAQCHASRPRRCRKPAGLKHARRLKPLRHMRASAMRSSRAVAANRRGLSMSGGSSHCGICARVPCETAARIGNVKALVCAAGAMRPRANRRHPASSLYICRSPG